VLVDAEATDTVVTAAPSKVLAKAGTPLTVTGRVVSADGSAPVGTVTVSDRGTVIATVELGAAAKGRIQVALPTLGRGIHMLQTTFTGADGWNDSQSLFPVPVVIY
jgi:hypothetical protein